MSKAKIQPEASMRADAQLAARIKSAADYSAPENDNRTPKEIEADLERIRLELESTVNELSARLTPAQLTQDATNKIKSSLLQLGDRLREFSVALINLDPQALKIAGGALVTLLVYKIWKR